MREETHIVLDHKELEALVGEFLGNLAYETLVADLGQNDARWQNDTTHTFEITAEEGWVQPNHDDHLKELRARGKPAWSWEVAAVLEEFVKSGRLKPGSYLIEICW